MCMFIYFKEAMGVLCMVSVRLKCLLAFRLSLRNYFDWKNVDY